MTDLVQLIQEADLAIVDMEQAKSAVESAKFALEMAKEDFEKSKAAFDAVISRADDHGVPRAKLKKLAEERAAALLASGLMSTPVNQQKLAKVKAPKKPKAARESQDDETLFESDGDVIQLNA